MTDSTRRISRRQAVRLLGGASLGLATGACGMRAEDLMEDYATVSQSAGRPITGLSLDNSQLLFRLHAREDIDIVKCVGERRRLAASQVFTGQHSGAGDADLT